MDSLYRLEKDKRNEFESDKSSAAIVWVFCVFVAIVIVLI